MGYTRRGRQEGWDYHSRWQASYPDHSTFAGLDYDERLAGACGMHFHFWVPRGTLKEGRAAACAAADEALSSRDVVSYSWDFIPETLVTDVTDLGER